MNARNSAKGGGLRKHRTIGRILGVKCWMFPISLAVVLAFGVCAFSAATTTTLVVDPSPSSVYGQSVTLTATVDPSAATGDVTFYDGAASLGTSSLSGGSAALVFSTLAVGEHELSAQYGGDGSYDPSTSAAVDHTVEKADTSVAVASSGTPSVTGETVTFTATVSVVSPGSGTPTGTVDFYANGDLIAEDRPMSSGEATCAKSFLHIEGPVDVVARYSGDGNYNESDNTLDPLTQEVNKASTSTSIDSSAASWLGEMYTVSGTVEVTSPGTGTPTGTVTVSDGTGESCAANLVAGAWSCSLGSSGAAGTRTLTAVYEGDENYAGSSGSTTHQVSTVTTTLTLTDEPDPSVIGEAVTLTATATAASGGGSPTGAVTFSIEALSLTLGSAVLASSGTDESEAVLVTTEIPLGTHTITATYPGDGRFEGDTATAEHTVNKRTTTTTVFVSDTPLVVGDTATGTVRVEGVPTNYGAPPTGDVTLSWTGNAELNGDSTPPVTHTLTAAEGGYFEFTYMPTDAAAASHIITASYAGDDTYYASSDTFNQSILKRAIDVQLICSPVDVYINQPVECTVILSDDTTAGTPVVPDEAYLTLSDDRHSGPTRFSTVSWSTVGNDRVGTFTYTPAAWDTDADQVDPWVAQSQATATITASYAGSPEHTNAETRQPLTVRLRPTETSVDGPDQHLLVYQAGSFSVQVTDTAGIGTATAPSGLITVTPSLSPIGESVISPPIGTAPSWGFTYVRLGLDNDGDYDTLAIAYTANDGIHANSGIGYAQAIIRRPTVTTLSGCACTATGVTCIATVADDPNNPGPPGGLPLPAPAGDFMTMNDDDGDGFVDYVDVGDAPGPASVVITSDLIMVNVTVQYHPTDRIYQKSTGSENIDRSDCMPDPGVTPGDATSCTAGCGEGGVNVYSIIDGLNAGCLAARSLALVLDAAMLAVDPTPDPIIGAGFLVITGSTIPTSDILATIVGIAKVALETYSLIACTDSDGDGIQDVVELGTTGTDPYDRDTDGDAMSDDDEIGYCAGYYGGSLRPNPNNSDSDGDGLLDGYEMEPFNTDVCVADTDCDTLPDGIEIACRTSPTAASGFDMTTFAALGYSGYSFPFADPRDQPNPREADTDGDGLRDDVEFGPGRLATSISDTSYSPYINDADSDGDGILDGNESTNGDAIWDYTQIGGTGTTGSGETHLCLADTDGDGLLDGEEEALFGRGAITVHSPLGTETVTALDDDSDDDGLSDYEEVHITGTDPLNWDTDGDGIGDAQELIVLSGEFPMRTFDQESNPLDQDTDHDGLPDNIEYSGTGVTRTSTAASNPGTRDLVCPYVSNPDSDNDGLLDGYEDQNHNGVWDYTVLDQSSTSHGIGETKPCDPDTDDDGLLDGEEEGLFGQGWVAIVHRYGSTTLHPALDDDSDNDGLSDWEEVNVTGTNPLHWDTDGDGISDADELISTGGTWPRRTFIQESDPLDPDTDDDGIPDGVEWTVGHTYAGTRLGDPSSAFFRGGATGSVVGGDPDTICPYVNDDDSDDDGLQDGYEDKNQNGIWDEYGLGNSTSEGWGETCACDPDSDRDGLSDGEEEGLLGRTATPQGVSTTFGAHGVAGAATVPALDDDSDSDGLSDYEEVNVTHTDPLDADSDDDTLSDANELIATGWLVLNLGYSLNFDPREFQQESDPLDPDTDDDDLHDYIEYPGSGLGTTRGLGGTPDLICPYVNDDDSDDDGLQDGVEDANHDGTWGVAGSGITVGDWASQASKTVEYWECDLCNPDTDGDGLLDGEEVQLIGGGPILGRPRPSPGFYTVTPEAVSTALPIGTNPVPAGFSHPTPIPGTNGVLIAPYTFAPAAGVKPPVLTTIPALDSDSDNDGLSDYEEVNITSTDPLDQDSDNDTLMDSDELIATGGAWPRRTFDQESDPLDINTDDDHLFDPQEYTGSGLSALAPATGGARDTQCPFVNDDDSDNDGIQDGAVVPVAPAGVITATGAPYSYVHYEDFIDLEPADAAHPGVVRTVATPGYGEQQDDALYNVCDCDSDGDGLYDGEEIAIGTNPGDWDTDDDGRNDWHEVTGGGPIPTDPFDPDTDDDGLLDSAEVFGGNPTNPVNADTDGDGLCDGGAGTPWMTSGDARVVVNPVCKSCSTPGLVDCGAASVRVGSPDGIGDHPNRLGLGEDQNGNGEWDTGETDPNQYDTDGDGLADGIERLSFSTSRQHMIPTHDLFGRPITVVYPEANNIKVVCGCLDPLNPDSDGDGLSDGYEDRNHDGNFDFLPSEFDHQDPLPGPPIPYPTETNPCDPDTDHDGLTDWEERFQRQPLDYYPALPFDDDGDGLIDEDPIDGIDNDGDGLIDEDPPEGPIELTFNPTNPLDHDTDNDWLLDGEEVYWVCVPLSCSQLDNDTDGLINEDPIDGIDNDGDGLIDEDPVDFVIRSIPMLDPTNRDSDSDGFIDGLDDDPCNSECIPVLPAVQGEPIDTDGDGFSDDDEIAAGTHPNDPEDHPIPFCGVDLDFDGLIDDWIWLEPAICCGLANSIVIDLDANALVDLRVMIVAPRDLKQGDFDGDGYEDDIRYTISYTLANYRLSQPRVIAIIDDYDTDLTIDWVVVERR